MSPSKKKSWAGWAGKSFLKDWARWAWVQRYSTLMMSFQVMWQDPHDGNPFQFGKPNQGKYRYNWVTTCYLVCFLCLFPTDSYSSFHVFVFSIYFAPPPPPTAAFSLASVHSIYHMTKLLCFTFMFCSDHVTVTWYSFACHCGIVFISLFSLTAFLFDFFWGYPSPLLSPPPAVRWQ